MESPSLWALFSFILVCSIRLSPAFMEVFFLWAETAQMLKPLHNPRGLSVSPDSCLCDWGWRSLCSEYIDSPSPAPALPLGPYLLETPLLVIKWVLMFWWSCPCPDEGCLSADRAHSTDTLHKPEICIGCVFLLLPFFFFKSEVGEAGKMPINEIYLHFKYIQIGTEPSITS